MAITRNITVTRKSLSHPIDIVYGTDLVTIEFLVTDFAIPTNAAALIYAVGSTGEVKKQICDISENSITITPEKNLFEEGVNIIQLRVTCEEKNLFTFKEIVNCSKNITDDDAVEAETSPTLVTQLLTKISVLSSRLDLAIQISEEATEGNFELIDIRVGADGTVYDTAGEAVREQYSQLSEEIANNTGGITTAFQTALLNFCANLVHVNENGKELYDNLELELTKITLNIKMVSISVIYTGGDVEAGTQLADLTGITVYTNYSDGSQVVIGGGYELSGEIVEGENTITVSYNGKNATFTVTGTPSTKVWLTFDSIPLIKTYYYSDDGETTSTGDNSTAIIDSTQTLYDHDVVVHFRFVLNWPSTTYAYGYFGSFEEDTKTVYRRTSASDYYIEGNGVSYLNSGNVYEGIFNLKAGCYFMVSLFPTGGSLGTAGFDAIDFTDCYAYIDLSEEV